MAELFIIDVFYYPQYKHKFGLATVTEIPRGTPVLWRIKFAWPRNRTIVDTTGFRIYFPEETPLSSKKKQLDDTIIPRGRVINGGIVSMEGEFKYGIKAINRTTEEDIYDEDPYLVVLPPNSNRFKFVNAPRTPQTAY